MSKLKLGKVFGILALIGMEATTLYLLIRNGTGPEFEMLMTRYRIAMQGKIDTGRPTANDIRDLGDQFNRYLGAINADEHLRQIIYRAFYTEASKLGN